MFQLIKYSNTYILAHLSPRGRLQTGKLKEFCFLGSDAFQSKCMNPYMKKEAT